MMICMLDSVQQMKVRKEVKMMKGYVTVAYCLMLYCALDFVCTSTGT